MQQRPAQRRIGLAADRARCLNDLLKVVVRSQANQKAGRHFLKSVALGIERQMPLGALKLGVGCVGSPSVAGPVDQKPTLDANLNLQTFNGLRMRRGHGQPGHDRHLALAAVGQHDLRREVGLGVCARAQQCSGKR